MRKKARIVAAAALAGVLAAGCAPTPKKATPRPRAPEDPRYRKQLLMARADTKTLQAQPPKGIRFDEPRKTKRSA